MKLLTAQQIKEWDVFTMEHEPVSSLDLMERAAGACVLSIQNRMKDNPGGMIQVFCGPGNNGGDGLAIGRLLADEFRVKVFVHESNTTSPDFKANLKRLKDAGKAKIVKLKSESDFPVLSEGIVVDALFGTGLNKPVTNIAAALIKHINQSELPVISIDIPSGLKADVFEGDRLDPEAIIKANQTLTFQVPKRSFMHAETAPFVGDFVVLDIGLNKEFQEKASSGFNYQTLGDMTKMVQPRNKFSHKGTFGHLLTIGGSFGKIGASLLMSKAALRTGCGLVTAYIPKVGYTILQTALPECMVMADDELLNIRHFPDDLSPYQAISVGPGMGLNEYTIKGFERWIGKVNLPVIIDADGLNICSRLIQEHHESFRFPSSCILTPHPKEFDRLAGISMNSFERLEKQVRFSKQYNVTVVLKGAHTSVSLPDGRVFFNSTGNVAMATAGSGDALSGIIGSFLAQGYGVNEAACIGVFLHGKAGDKAAEKKAALIASDIIEAIPLAMMDMKK